MKEGIALGLIGLIIFLGISFFVIDYTENATYWVKGIIVVALIILYFLRPKGPDEGIVRGNV